MNRFTITIAWLGAALLTSATLAQAPKDDAGQLPAPDGKPADMTQPVKVVIIMGQSNTLEFGKVAGDKDGTLEHAVKKENLYPFMIDAEGNWTERKDVRYIHAQGSGGWNGKTGVRRNMWLTVPGGAIGIEQGIGHQLGTYFDEPVMVLKASIGNRGLGWDLLPPGSPSWEHTDAQGKVWVYAGYGQSPAKWEKGTPPRPGGWKAGLQYDGDVARAKAVLKDLAQHYPGATGYEVVGFLWWQGCKDRGNPAYFNRYERHLAALFRSLREDFNAPNAKFVAASLGEDKKGVQNGGGKILEAIMNLADPDQHPEFAGSFAGVYTHPLRGGPGGSCGHYGGNAKTYMNVGLAMGSAMVDLLKNDEAALELAKQRAEEAKALAAAIEAGEKGTFQRMEREDYRMDPAKIASVMQRLGTADPKTLGTADRFLLNYFSKDWAEVRQFLASVPEANAAKVYARILATVQPARGRPAPFMTPADIVGLIDAAPSDLARRRDWIDALGRIIDAALLKGEGHLLAAALERGTQRAGGRDPELRLVAGRLLQRTKFKDRALEFLPTYAESVRIADASVRNEVQGFLKSQLERDQVQSDELARAINDKYRALINPGATAEARDAALRTLMAEFNQVPTEIFVSLLGGMRKVDPALAATAMIKAAEQMSTVAGADRPRAEHARVLKLMADISEVLAHDVSVDDPPWRTVANLMADIWIQSVQTFQRHWPKYLADQRKGTPREPPCAEPAQLLAAAPRDAWLTQLSVDKQRRVALLMPRVIMYGPKPKDAIPMIVQAVEVNPEGGLQLAKEFVSGWAAMNNPDIPPDVLKRYNMPADQVIVVTPLMIRKNIDSLATVMRLLRENNVMPTDQATLASAFDACYGQAEVYEIADIEAVFGPIAEMPEGIFAALIGKMTDSLGKRWRDISVQHATKTTRRHADVLKLVREGYGRAVEMIERRLEAHPEDWHAMTRCGTLLSDWGDYEFFQTSTSETDSDRMFAYKEKNNEAFGYFKRASEVYVAEAADAQGRVSIDVFTAWFNSLLGFNSNGEINVSKAMNPDVLNVMRDLMWSLPEPSRRRHISAFAQYVDRRAEDKKKPLPPELRYKYLASGLVITRDSVFAMETRKQVEYFDELLEDVRLETRVDGPNTIGRGEDFGIIISLVHSDVLGELLNLKPYLSASSSGFRGARNMHRGPGPIKRMTNVRKFSNEFEKNIYESFSNFFEIRSITFSPVDVQSRPIEREGWSETVMAYVQVRALGVEVDRIPPLELDLNYFDLSGPVALPVKSAETGIRVTEDIANSRPIENLRVTQVLDPRSLVAGGNLTLEIKAEGFGLIADLDEIVDLSALEKSVPIREIKGDDAALINELRSDGEVVGVTAERNWSLVLDTTEINAGKPVTLAFPTLKVKDATLLREVYRDAERVPFEAGTILLGGATGADGEAGIVLPQRTRYEIWIGLFVLLAAAGAGFYWWNEKQRKEQAAAAEVAERFTIPARLDAFDVVTLLRHMSRHEQVQLTPAQRNDLNATIKRIETSCFDPSQSEIEPDELRRTAQQWVDAAS